MFSAPLPQISTPMFLPPAQVAYPGAASHVRMLGSGEPAGVSSRDEPLELGALSQLPVLLS